MRERESDSERESMWLCCMLFCTSCSISMSRQHFTLPLYLSIYLFMYVCMCVCMYVCMYVCVSVCVFVFIFLLIDFSSLTWDRQHISMSRAQPS